MRKPRKRKPHHAFEAILSKVGYGEVLLDVFLVTSHRSADAAYVAAEARCERERSLPPWPAAFVREINAPNNRTADRIDGFDRDDLGESPDY